MISRSPTQNCGYLRPMWYSWSSVQKPGDELQASLPGPSHRKKPTSRLLYCIPTLLDSTDTIATTSVHEICLSTTEMVLLWKQYVKNVHPLVMIFFDWEAELIILRASKDLTSLSKSERVLVSAVLLITIMSLSEQQCLDLLHGKKSQVLARFQRVVESSLLIADFAVTSERLVLQAFILYLVFFEDYPPIRSALTIF